MDSAERDFDLAMREIYAEAKRPPCNYNASYFLQMLNEHGGLGTARRLLAAPQVSDGFTQLYLRSRLDLTVERNVLRPKFRGLFTAVELETATARLKDLGYKVDGKDEFVKL
ncbi:MAG: hypothetical protein FJ319_14305 [SAR202 cluster bacterium]|nr:hypothetical protein [SAR202 cluster bacterium]